MQENLTSLRYYIVFAGTWQLECISHEGFTGMDSFVCQQKLDLRLHENSNEEVLRLNGTNHSALLKSRSKEKT